jgi:hypothetical protein
MTPRRNFHREDRATQTRRDSLELPHHRGDPMLVPRLLRRQMNRATSHQRDGKATKKYFFRRHIFFDEGSRRTLTRCAN